MAGVVTWEHAVGPAELARLPALRVVVTPSVGFDDVDLDAARSHGGVWVCHVPDYCVDEMAETALALVLALMRGVVQLDRDVRAGAWDVTTAGPLRRIRGTRLGIVSKLHRVGLQLGDVGIAVQRVEAAGGVPGRAGSQLRALDQHDVGPAGLGQVVEHRAANDAAADHNRFDLGFHGFASVCSNVYLGSSGNDSSGGDSLDLQQPFLVEDARDDGGQPDRAGRRASRCGRVGSRRCISGRTGRS